MSYALYMYMDLTQIYALERQSCVDLLCFLFFFVIFLMRKLIRVRMQMLPVGTEARVTVNLSENLSKFPMEMRTRTRSEACWQKSIPSFPQVLVWLRREQSDPH